MASILAFFSALIFASYFFCHPLCFRRRYASCRFALALRSASSWASSSAVGSFTFYKFRRQISTDKVKVDFDLLSAVRRSLHITFVNEDFIDQFKEHRVCQLIKVRIFINELDKAVSTFCVLVVFLNALFAVLNFLCQLLSLCFIG